MSTQSPPSEAQPQRSKWHPLRWMRAVYEWMMRFADKPYAGRALFGISFAEASFFPIPPDPLLMVMGAAQPKRALRFATITTLGSVAGALLGFAIGMFLMGTKEDPSIGYWVINTYDPDQVIWGRIRDWFAEYGLVALLIAAITPIPFKVFTIATGAMVAGGEEISLWAFTGACLLGRGFRFYIEGFLLRYFGDPIVVWMEKWFDLLAILFTVLLIGGFALLKFVGHE